MHRIKKHIIGSLLAGFVAMLPIGGLIITVGYLESSLSSAGIASLPFYFPGLGIIVAVLFIYIVGLVVTTFVGGWLWARLDRLLEKVPTLGTLYQALKNILGYGGGEEAVFYEAVLVPNKELEAEELGLVTKKLVDTEGNTKLVVFIPGAPNPTSGRLLLMDKNFVKPLEMPINETLKALVSMGKTDFNLQLKS